MSKYTKMADEEAARVAAEEAADAATVDGDAAAEPGPDFGPVELSVDGPSMEEAMEMLSRETERHRVSLETIIGDDFAQFIPCVVCQEMGYRALGDLPWDPSLEECPTCRGHGLLQTHSRHPEHAVRQCLRCQGQGFVTTTRVPEPVAPPAPPAPMFDPYTGLPLNGTQAVAGAASEGPWAPGYVPSAQPAFDPLAPRY